MVRPTARIEESQRNEMHKNIVSILNDLVKSNATKRELLIAARVIRLGRAVGLDDVVVKSYINIVSGDNKHKTNFIEALGE